MFSNPYKNLKAFGLAEDSVVADLGAGTGYYAVAAGALAPRGKVYAIELSQDYLEIVGGRLKDAGLSNVEVIWGNIERPGGTKLKDAVADAVLISNVLSQVEDRAGLIEEAKRILRQNGRVLLVDWAEAFILRGGRPIPKTTARELFESRGFTFEREIPAGDHHYGMILRKS